MAPKRTRPRLADLPLLLTLTEAADVLGCSRNAVACSIRRGDLKGKRTPGGREWRIRRADVRAFLDAMNRRALDNCKRNTP